VQTHEETKKERLKMANEETQTDTKTEKQEEKNGKSEESSKDAGVDTNVVLIGSKPFINYVKGVVLQIKTKGNKEVTIKARGKFINRAVDVAEAVRKKFLKEQNLQIKNIAIDSQELENKKGKKVNVSMIEITLAKK